MVSGSKCFLFPEDEDIKKMKMKKVVTGEATVAMPIAYVYVYVLLRFM